MNTRHPMAAAALALLLTAGAGGPALAAMPADPTVPVGCTFDGSVGVLTCVTTSATTELYGPNTFVGASTTTGLAPGFTGLDWCRSWAGDYPWKRFSATDLVVTQVTTTTTTTMRHGLKGKLISTDATRSVDNTWESRDWNMCTTLG